MKNIHCKGILECEEAFLNLFCTKFKFSNTLVKYVDTKVFDMYDHNFFKHTRYTTTKDIEEAYQYQYDNYFDFLKLISNEKLNRKVVEKTKLEENVILTMIFDNKKHNFTLNNQISIKTITLQDLNKIETKHYAKIYGKDFLLRRNEEFINVSNNTTNFKIYGAYINNKIVGECYSFTNKNYTCIDSLLVDNKYRHQKIATTLLKYIIDQNNYVYLHAEQDDTPKEMYKKLGFKVVDKSYEYFRKIDITK